MTRRVMSMTNDVNPDAEALPVAAIVGERIKYLAQLLERRSRTDRSPIFDTVRYADTLTRFSCRRPF